MTMPGNMQDALKTAIGDARSKWGWFVALGALLAIVGVIAAGNLFLATVASVFFVGSLMLIAGIFEIIHAFGVKDWGGFLWWLGSGLLYAIAGLVAFNNPLLASAVLTFLLAVTLIAAGGLRLWVGYKHWSMPGSGWIVTAGAVTALAGIVIAIGWPVNSLWILGMFLAIDLMFQGLTFIAFGLQLRK